MIGSATAAAAIIVVAALWVAFAATLAILAARRMRRAHAVLGAARSMRSLLDAAPARALLVYPDGRIEADAQLVRELGLSVTPGRLEQLSGGEVGLDQGDLTALTSALDDVRLSGTPLRRQLQLAGRDRVVEVRAALAPPPAKPGTVLVWI